MDKKIIIHIDMNCYFASVEQQANPFLRGKPIGITGKRYENTPQPRSVITTASIEAKLLGVKTAMSTFEARRVCPSIILYPGDPEKYSHIMHRFNAIFRKYTSKVDQFSVDESFLNVTEEAEDYLGATCIAQNIRQDLKQQCGERITASIGIAPNKLMAKLACESMKPNGLTVVKEEDLISFIDSRKLQDLCGIGPRIENHLHNLGIYSFKQLREFSHERLKEEFNKYGTWLYKAARGEDSSIILAAIQKGVAGSKTTQASTSPPKSVGHSYTLPRDTYDPTEIRRYLLKLSDKVGWRLRRDCFTAKRVKVYLRYGDFSGVGQQKNFQEPTANGLILFKNAWQIISKIYDPDRPVRLVGISASQITPGPSQTSLFKKDQKMEDILQSLDCLQKRYGDHVWTRASLINTKIKPRSSGFHFDHEI